MIDNGEWTEQPEVKHQLLRERERDRGQTAVQAAFVVLEVDPVQRAQMEGTVRGVVPYLGPDRRHERRVDERKPPRALEAAEVNEYRQDDRVRRCMQRVSQL